VEVFALRKIDIGEEISFSCTMASSLGRSRLIFTDVPLEMSQKRRTAALKDHWGFKCTCSACTASSDAIADSDGRREEITEIQNALGGTAEDPESLLGLLEQLLKLYDDEGLITPKPRYYEIAAYTANQLGDEYAATSYAQMAFRHWSIVAGPESWDARRMEAMLEDPKKHPSWLYKVTE
jgi:hypothetical protein